MAETDSAARPRAPATGRVLVELLALEREILELEYVRRTDALARVSDAVRRLGELSVAEGILARAAAELGASSDFDRVLISEVVDGQMTPLTIWSGHDQEGADAALPELKQDTIRLEYPLLEYEVAKRGVAEVVVVARARARTPGALTRCLRWESYVVAALSLGGETIGLLHADATDSARAVDALDAEVAARYAEELSGVFERAVLRHTLDLHRAELGSAVHWLGARLSGLEDAAGLVGGRGPGLGAEGPAVDPHLVESLTKRELDVLRLLARGNTNRAIANALVVREGTVKYHVKNILRKLGATSRADAVAKFVRAGGGEARR
jgi:DNA-binding NarL/FixJ family response regulator